MEFKEWIELKAEEDPDTNHEVHILIKEAWDYQQHKIDDLQYLLKEAREVLKYYASYDKVTDEIIAQAFLKKF